MDAGPGTDLGTLGWFLGVWVVMMAAMMFPSLAPTTGLYARMTRRRGWSRPLLFTGGYLAVWGAAGLVAYAVFRLGRASLGGDLGWGAGGRWVAGGVLAVAAIYELTPLKDVCLGKCRSPLGFLLGTWRDGKRGALEMGSRHAAWCLGCCWALMAGLFALGVMSLTWMALDRGAHRAREDGPVAPGRNMGHRRRSHRARCRGSRNTRQRAGAGGPRRRLARHAIDESSLSWRATRPVR